MFGRRRARRERREAEAARHAEYKADGVVRRPWLSLLETCWPYPVSLDLDETWTLSSNSRPDGVVDWPTLPPGTFCRMAAVQPEKGPVYDPHLLVGVRVDPPAPSMEGPERLLADGELLLLSNGEGLLAAIAPVDRDHPETYPDTIARLVAALDAFGAEG